MQPDISKLFGYGLAAITFTFGMLLLLGLMELHPLPSVRYTFGIVLVLMGVYRFLITKWKPKPSKYRRFTSEE